MVNTNKYNYIGKQTEIRQGTEKSATNGFGKTAFATERNRCSQRVRRKKCRHEIAKKFIKESCESYFGINIRLQMTDKSRIL